MNDLICLHAAGSSSATWNQLRPDLTSLGYRVHCPALLGHRGAERRNSYSLEALRDDVLRECDRIGLDSLTIVGHSLGAFIASMVAVQQPDRVRRLVLEEMPVPPRSYQDKPPARKQAAGAAMRALAFLGRLRFDPTMMRDTIAQLREPQPQWWAALPSVTAPTLFLAGGNSSHLDQSRYELVTETLPAAAIVTVDAGHRIHSHSPKRWLAAATDFLAAP